MRQAVFRFFGNLKDFFPAVQQGGTIDCTFDGHESVKHLVEALGVPHTEVARLLANGQRIAFDYNVRDGDRIEVHPFEPEIAAGPQRFVLDNHLGRLASYLRMLGFDSLYRNDYQDEELAQVASEQNRTLLTRDRRLLMRSMVQYGYCVRSTIPRQQVQEVILRFQLAPSAAPFLRCQRCNGLLQKVEKQAVLHALQPLTRQYFDEFRICADCGQVYWKGSHYQRMQEFICQLLGTQDLDPQEGESTDSSPLREHATG